MRGIRRSVFISACAGQSADGLHAIFSVSVATVVFDAIGRIGEPGHWPVECIEIGPGVMRLGRARDGNYVTVASQQPVQGDLANAGVVRAGNIGKTGQQRFRAHAVRWLREAAGRIKPK
jgi:hypothetical protein